MRCCSLPLGEASVRMHFTAAACYTTRVDIVQSDTTDHVAQAQSYAQPTTAADPDISPSKRLPPDESSEYALRQEVENLVTLYGCSESKAEKVAAATVPLGLNVQKIIHAKVVKSGVTDAVGALVSYAAAKAIVLAASAVFIAADANSDRSSQHPSLAATNAASKLREQYESLVDFTCSKTANTRISPDDAKDLFNRAMDIYRIVFKELCDAGTHWASAGMDAERAATVTATIFRSIYIAMHGTEHTAFLLSKATFFAVSSAICMYRESYHAIRDDKLSENLAICAASAVALSACDDCFASYGKTYVYFIDAGVPPIEAEEFALAAYKIVLRECGRVYAFCVFKLFDFKLVAAFDDAIGVALSDFKAGFSCYLKLYLELFTTVIDAEATPKKAAEVSARFFRVISVSYFDIFSFVIKAKATSIGLFDPFKGVLDAAAKFFHGILSVVSAKTSAGPETVYSAAFHALSELLHSCFKVFVAHTEAKATPVEAANASNDFFDISNRFYHNVFVAIPTRTTTELVSTRDFARFAFDDLSNVYWNTFAAATKAKATLADAASISNGVLAVADKIYLCVLTTAIKDFAAVASKIYPRFLSANIDAFALEDARRVVLLVLKDIGKIYDLFAATEAQVAPLIAAKTADAAAEVPTAPSPAAKIAGAAVSAFGIIYAKIFYDLHISLYYPTIMIADVASLDVDDKDPSLIRSADGVYRMTFGDAHTAARFAGLDLTPAFSAAQHAAVAVQDTYYSEFKKVRASPGFADATINDLTGPAFAAAAAICCVYRDNFVSCLKIDAPIADTPAAQVDAVGKRLEDAL